LTLVETLLLNEAPIEDHRHRRSLDETRQTFPSIEFTDESGNLTAVDGSFNATTSSTSNEDLSYFEYDDDDESDENSTFTISGSGSKEEWMCELAEADAVASGVDFVRIYGLDDAFFVTEGVISGETMMIVPTGYMEGDVLVVPDDAEVTLENIMPPKESKARESNRRHLRIRNRNKNQRRLRLTTGTKSMLVIRVVANDAEVTPSLDKLRNDIFEDDNCLKSQYARCSFNKLIFVKATGKDVIGGVLNLNLNKNVIGRDRNTVQLEVQDAAKVHFGNNPNWRHSFDHVMICLPPGTAGDWIAYAYVNSWLSIYNDEFCSSVSAHMHGR
jgi:hypothetical protein